MNQENNTNTNVNQNTEVEKNINTQGSNTNQNVVPTNVNSVTTDLPQPSVAPTNVNSVTTDLPQPSVVTVSNQVKENVSQPNNQSNNQPDKGGSFKLILTFIFLIGMVAFVFFLPQISEFVKTKQRAKTTSGSDLLENGTLICKMDRSSDETDIYYEFKFLFNDKSLVTSKLTTRIESVNSLYLEEKKSECDQIALISNNVSGISTSCSSAIGVLTIIENYTHKDINNTNLTSYTEIGGTYPEFEYGKNIYDIESSLVKEGYNCDVTATVE